MHTDLLNEFKKFLEKQDMLSNLTEHEKLHNHSYSKIHVIDAIGSLEHPNVTTIATYLHMTKGAISKIITKLKQEDIITTYSLPPNKQKIFYSLTKTGLFLYEEHKKRHQLWLKRDQQFLDQFSKQQLQSIESFMQQYNIYLEQQIKELGGK